MILVLKFGLVGLSTKKEGWNVMGNYCHMCECETDRSPKRQGTPVLPLYLLVLGPTYYA